MRPLFPSVNGLSEKLFKEYLRKVNIVIENNKAGYGGCALAEEEEQNANEAGDSIELMPCPHCGSTDLELVGGKGMTILGVTIPDAEIYFVRCKCTATGARDVSKQGAINQWNKRVKRDQSS